MHPSEAQARVLLGELIAQGVTDVVLCPGSRSAPLAFALHALDAAGSMRLHVRIDERSGAFTALGLAKSTGRPTAVVTTSGTATANLHPAVLEAHHGGVPLVVLTADRPPELRGVGANQATDQLSLFGPAVRLFHEVGVARREPGQVGYWRDVALRAVAAATGTRSRDPGPVHLNLAFAEPLTPAGGDEWVEALTSGALRRVERPGPPAPYELPAGDGTVVVAGDGSGADARELAEAGGWPLLAEPSSGARSGPNAIGGYRLLLDAAHLGGAIRRVIAYGRPTLSRPVTRLLARADVELIVVGERPMWTDPARRASLVVARASTGRGGPDDWLDLWRTAGAAALAAIDNTLAAEPGLPRLTVAAELDRCVPADALLVVGSSNPIRDLDLVASAGRDVLANRGLAGIDGMVSTAVGAALGVPDRQSYALLGDLTFLHDVNGLLLGPAEPRPDLTIIVGNDRGGGIFATLEPGAPKHGRVFERAFGTPHEVDLGALCAAYGVRHARATTAEELRSALGPPTGLSVVEVPVDRSRLRELNARLAAAVTRAVEVRGLPT